VFAEAREVGTREDAFEDWNVRTANGKGWDGVNERVDCGPGARMGALCNGTRFKALQGSQKGGGSRGRRARHFNHSICEEKKKGEGVKKGAVEGD